MQYLYLVIFIFFILLNVVIGLASSRSKKRRAAAGHAQSESEAGSTAGATAVDESDAVAELQRSGDSRESVLSPQTAGSIVESFFEVDEEKASLPGGEAEKARVGTAENGIPDVGPAVQQEAESVVQSNPMIDISSPRQEVTLSIERNLLGSEVEARALERRRAQDEKYRTHDQLLYQDTETGAWEKIQRLSPLKRAILFSEILASPKGLSDLSEGRHSE
jgi:hypothetical protein